MVVFTQTKLDQLAYDSHRMNNSEKFCLKWNDFKESVGSAFGSMREDLDFADTTLACEDGQQLSAHKVILAASSPFFHKLLKRNKQPHQLVYMRGMKFEDLKAVVDFLYYGEANIFQDNLDVFLNIAEELQLKGLTGEDTAIKTEEPFQHPLKSPQKFNVKNKKPSFSNIHENDNQKYLPPSKEKESFISEGTVAIPSQRFSSNLSELDEQIKSLMVIGQTHIGKELVRICTVCGKEGNFRNIKDHIEANHIEGVSHPCDLCEKTFRSRPSLRVHKYSNHK